MNDLMERVRDHESRYQEFAKISPIGLDRTLKSLRKKVVELETPFSFDVDSDMAKFTFGNARRV
jgi:hypothetical protein